MQCYSNANKGQDILPACEGEWSDPDGQDLAPIKDATVVLELVMSLNYVYKLYFADYQPEDERHKVIKGWFESFYHRIKPANNFFFGNFAGFYFPNIAIQHSQNKNYKSMVKNMVKGLDEWTLDDGSMKNRTTRGDRALWYHHAAIGEAFVIMEIARTANVEIPATLEKKLLKAVELFHDAYLDHSVIEPWAKEAHNSQASNGHQKFQTSLDWVSFLSAWFNIFQLRYPEHRTAQWLNQELTSKADSLKIAEYTGVTLGCIHKALADSSPEGLAKKEAERIKAASELSIFKFDGETFNLALDKVDFSETGTFELEREEEGYLEPFQLHKGHINGYLNTKSNGIKKLRTLVYKYAGNQELVIHVDDRTVEPLKRHKDSLEKKCGSKVMEWGWLSFISQTNDVKSARNQQCIYDYFKEANDSEAWELFQAVLGGTDSILDYLETNVVATKEEEKRIPADLELPIFDDVEYKLEGQILKINIRDPKMKPLMRHMGGLTMKCGSALIDTKSGWISFVSSNSNSRTQQCHYDYFQKSNDSEALELFKAVLSGTDSILDYLQK
jgi:hypothetical protein